MKLLRVFLSLFRRRVPQDKPDPMQEVDAALAQENPMHFYDREPRATPPQNGQELPKKRIAKPGTLAAVIGFAAAAIALAIVPEDESGRKVDVKIADDGSAKVRHVRGPQYLKAYLDVAGIATACDGIIRMNGRPVRIGDVFTAQECDAALERELIAHAEGMMRCTATFLNHPNKELIGNTLAATTSFTYNVGVGGYCGSTVARRFNAGDWLGACDAMLMWNKARVNGVLQPIPGLTSRRQRERALCLKGL